jgi:hypothetical protein
MPIKLSELIAKSAKRSFDYEGEPVKVEIFTQKVTPAYRAQWETIKNDPTREVRCQLIADFLKSWDVLGDDDQSQPISYEFLLQCPDGFLNQLTELIEDVVFPNPTNASSSPSGSQPTMSQPEN